MPNQSGVNQFQKQPAYGDVKRLTTLTKSAPISGAPALNAPRKAQRQATRGRSGQTMPPAPVPPTTTPYATELALVYQELARHAPDDDLIRYYAEVASRQAG